MTTAKPKIKYKTFTYDTSLDWTGNRKGLMQSGGKPRIAVSSPLEFKGEAGVWTPEDFYLAAVESCLMTTFIAFAQHKHLAVLSYTSRGHGVLEYVDGKYRMTKITLNPTIVVETPDAVELAEKILEGAHKNCIISNSIKTEVVVQGDIHMNAPDIYHKTPKQTNHAGV